MQGYNAMDIREDSHHSGVKHSEDRHKMHIAHLSEMATPQLDIRQREDRMSV